MTSGIYHKSLTLSNDARQKTTVGDISTRMSVDAGRIQNSVYYFPLVTSSKNWSTWMEMSLFGHEDSCLSLPVPLQICIGIFLLYRTLGWSIFVGLATMIISMPLNFYLTVEKRKVSKDQMKNRDARAQLMVVCSFSQPRAVA